LIEDYDAIALYSGGTDSTLAPILARPTVGDNVLLLMIDLGEPKDSMVQARERAKLLGWDFRLIDGTSDFAEQMLAETIKFRGNYWGYPLGTPLGRAFQCAVANKLMAELNVQEPRRRYLIHGCSARQNTRFRIERSCDTAEDIMPMGPLVTSTFSRAEKVELLEAQGIATGPSDNLARDENIFCRALEGDGLNNLLDSNSLGYFTLVKDLNDTPDDAELVTLGFESGRPVSLNNEPATLDAIVIACRDLGAAHGVGRICMFEDTVPELGYKERSLFESPASVILYRAHQYLEAAVLGKAERELMRTLRHEWAELVYRGNWAATQRLELAQLADRLQARISGSVDVTLWKGNCVIGAADIPDARMIRPGELAGTY
jgi:argininosuccinate synthase